MEATDSSSEKEDEADELRLMNHSSLKEQCDITNNISTDCAKDENYLENSGNLVGDSKDTENQAIRIKNEEEVDIENEDKERDMDSIDGEKDDIENFLSQNRFLSKGSANEEEEVCQNRKNIIKTEEKNDEDESTDQSPSDKREVANEPQDVEDGFLKFLKMCAGGKAKAKYLIDQDDEMYGFDDKSESKPSKHRHKKRPPLYRSPNICLSPTPLSVHYEEAYNQKFDFQTDPKQNNHENVIQKPTEIKPQQESGLANEVVDETQYNFSYPQRGHLVLIVNDRFLKQSPRIGANWDLQKTKQIASKLGFRIFNSNHCRNLTKKETIAVLRQAQHHDHSDSDCFMFVISTHGLEIRNPRAKGKLDHVIVCSDDQFIFTSSILDMFNDRNCPTLKNKPKMFFIQACRGEKYDRGSEVLVSRSNGNTDRTDRAGTHESRPDKPADRPRQQKQRSLDVTDTRPSGDSWAASASYRTAVNAQLNQPIRSLTGDASVPNIDDLTNLPTQHSTARVWSSGGQPTLNENQRVTSASQPQMKNNLGENMAPMPYPVNDTPSLQCDNDFLVMYAIPPGYFAWRNTSDGSWMLDYLHSTVMSYDTKDPQDFLKLLRKVSQRMSRRQTNTPSDPKMHESKAIPVIEHKLVKDIIFKPKAVMSKWMRADIYPLI